MEGIGGNLRPGTEKDSARRLALERVFDAAREGLRDSLSADEYARRKSDFVFHLSDCREDLDGLSTWLRAPDLEDEDAAVSNLIGILYHIIPHLGAAGRLLLDKVDDPFLDPSVTSVEA